MRIDINTPITARPDEKKESKIIKARQSQSGDPSLSTHKTELESDLKKGPNTDEAQLINFLEERKKRREKLKLKSIKRYLKVIDAIAETDIKTVGGRINVRI